MYRSQSFTLMELVAVIAIMMIGIGLASVSLRSGSDVQKFEQATREFQGFLAQSRWRAMELGKDQVIVFNPNERNFSAENNVEKQVSFDLEKERVLVDVPAQFEIKTIYDNSFDEEEVKRKTLKWDLPDEFEFKVGDDNLGNGKYGDNVEIFRFFPDGGGSGSCELVLRFKDFGKIITISPLTGMIKEQDLKSDDWF